METYLYICEYCSNNFTPKRRGIQRFCRSSCRASAHNKNKKQSLSVPASETKKDTNNSSKIEKMSWAGVGNAAAGTAVVNTVAHFLTKEENRPATKKDIKEIITALKQRYFVVKNMKANPDGSHPYFDIQTNNITFLKNNR